jgi:Asp-tRNA(Asn)/Glu-tRNA(Gln) amidotransferase C subunit
MDARPAARQQITAWATPDRKGQFAALAASRGLSESKLLGLLVDSVLERNPVDEARDDRNGEAGDGDRISLRLRPGDGKLLRLRAHARGMKYTTYTATLIRAHVRADPPMPLDELARLERSLAEVSVLGRTLSQIARRISEGQGVDTELRSELTVVLHAVEKLRQTVREVVRVNRISWESGDAEAR